MACDHPPAYLYNTNEQSYYCVFCAHEELTRHMADVRRTLETPQGPNSFIWVRELARQRIEELAALRQKNAQLMAGLPLKELERLREENARLKTSPDLQELARLREENTRLKAAVEEAAGMLRNL